MVLKDNLDNNNQEYHPMLICNLVFHNSSCHSLIKEVEEFHLTNNNNRDSCLKALILNSLWVEDNHNSLKTNKCL